MGLKNDFLQACFKSIKLIKKRLNKLTVSSQQEVLIYFLIPNLFHVKHVRKAMMRDQGPSIGENGLRGLEWDRTWGGLGSRGLGLGLDTNKHRKTNQ